MKHLRTMLVAAVSTMLLSGASALAQSPGKHGGPPPPPGSQSAPSNNAPPAGSPTPAPATTGVVPVHGQSGGAAAESTGAPVKAKGKKGKKGKTNHPAPGGAATAPAGNGGH